MQNQEAVMTKTLFSQPIRARYTAGKCASYRKPGITQVAEGLNRVPGLKSNTPSVEEAREQDLGRLVRLLLKLGGAVGR